MLRLLLPDDPLARAALWTWFALCASGAAIAVVAIR